jgi:DNA-binding response OmpR family regulator
MAHGSLKRGMDSHPRSLLLVEDDEHTRAFLADNLTADGFRVATASEAGEALRAIEVRRPDLVLLDLMLGGGSGLDVLDRVRGADGPAARIDPDLPVIVLSGRTAEVDRVRGFARGADDYVTKPTLRLSPRVGKGSRCSSGTMTSPSRSSSADLTACGRTWGST